MEINEFFFLSFIRISRALLLSCQKTILPKEQWTKVEEDVRYLMPYVDEIRREKAEKAEWSKGNTAWFGGM